MMLELSLNQMKAVQGEALRTPCAVRSEPLSRNPPGWGFGHISLKNERPVQAGSKF